MCSNLVCATLLLTRSSTMMMHLTRWLLVPAVIVGWLSFAGTAHAQASKRSSPAKTVVDDGGFFSDKAKEKADEEIAEIKKKYKRDLLIETFAKAPESIAKVDLKNRQEKNHFFDNWAKKRATNANVNIYVLICKDPAHVQVEMDEKTRESGAFTNSNREELAKELVTNLRAKKYDDAL